MAFDFECKKCGRKESDHDLQLEGACEQYRSPDQSQEAELWRHERKHRVPDRKLECEWLRQEIVKLGGKPCC